MCVMFEMFATIVAACVAAIYGLSRSVFMTGVHRNLYRAAFIGIIIVAYVTYRIYHYIKFKNIKKMNVDLDDYLYYDKYTSPLYRAGYFISYLVQNILFDYTYMKRNYNFCKGLDVYDGGVSEYYIKFRNTWYRYLKLTLIRHRISLKKLQAFSCDMKNEMIIAALDTPEKKELYHLFEKEAENTFQEQKSLDKKALAQFTNVSEIMPLFQKNILKRYRALAYATKKEPELVAMVKKQEFRRERDVNDFKKTNFR